MRVSEQAVREAVAASRSWAETLRRLDYCPTGNGRITLKKYVRLWEISVDHFDPYSAQLDSLKRVRNPTPMEEILVEGSTHSRWNLKRRLYAKGLKERRCELCGQPDVWRGRQMTLILDHVNGVRDDHRLENLRIVCPNCAATLDTHCGKNIPRSRTCEGCGSTFSPKRSKHRYCSHPCFVSSQWREHGPRPETRKVERPPYEQLLREIDETSYLAVGRKYGVSDNAIRKWVVWYERELEAKRTQKQEPPAKAA
jgi:hypothetical protein